MKKKAQQVLACFLCIVIIFFSMPVQEVEAIAVVDDLVITYVILTTVYGMGVTTIDGVNLKLMTPTNQALFANDIYQKLPFATQNEINTIAKQLKAGETKTFTISNKMLKAVYENIQANLIAVDNELEGEHRKFKFDLGNQEMASISIVNNVAKFKRYLYKGQSYYYDIPLKKSIKFSEKGLIVKEAFVLMSGRPRGLNLFSDKIQYQYADKILGSLYIGSNKVCDIKASVTLYSDSYNVTCKLGGVSTGRNDTYNNRYHHGLPCLDIHPVSTILYILTDYDNNYYYALGYSDRDGSFGSRCELMAAFNVIKFANADDLKKNDTVLPLKFELMFDIDDGELATVIDGLADDEGRPITIGVTGEGTLVLPADKTDAVDITGTGTGVITLPGSLDLPDLDMPNILYKFPFCIPADIYRTITLFSAPAVVPKWTMKWLTFDFVLDFSIFNTAAVIVRWTFYTLFLFGLIKITRSIIKG